MLRKCSLLTGRGNIHVMKSHTDCRLAVICWNQTGTSSAQRAHGNFVEIITTNKSKRLSKIYSLKKMHVKNSLCDIHKKAIENNNIPQGSSITLSHNKSCGPDQNNTSQRSESISMGGLPNPEQNHPLPE